MPRMSFLLDFALAGAAISSSESRPTAIEY
jgi:hypothetical protein